MAEGENEGLEEGSGTMKTRGDGRKQEGVIKEDWGRKG